MKIAYLDCFSGISGDMFVGALLDAGLSFDKLQKEMTKLKLSGFGLEAKKVKKHKLSGTKFTVKINKKQPQRDLQDIIKIINNSNLESDIKKQAKEIFVKLAQVEAKIHHVNINKIHFHEIGAIDTIIDVVASLYGLKELDIKKIYVSSVNVGKGWVKTSHGVLPVPAPVTLELLKDRTIYSSGIGEELTTPTGAVLISFLGEKTDQLPPLKPEVIGYGAGDKNFDEYPNLLRIIIGQENEAPRLNPDEINRDGIFIDFGGIRRSISATQHGGLSFSHSSPYLSRLKSGGFSAKADKIPGSYQKEDLIQIETNIDDLNPQIFGYLMERLFSEGALDVWFSQIQMKKNRPGICLGVLIGGNLLEKILEIIFTETTTWGIRCYQVSRYKIPTKYSTLKTKFGRIKVKLGWVQGKVKVIPEYEECKKIAQARQIPLKLVLDEITKEQR